jgi:hypothetical protein
MEQKKLEERDEIKDGKTDFISSVNSFSKYVSKEINADIGNKSFFMIPRDGDQFACANIGSTRELGAIISAAMYLDESIEKGVLLAASRFMLKKRFGDFENSEDEN